VQLSSLSPLIELVAPVFVLLAVAYGSLEWSRRRVRRLEGRAPAPGLALVAQIGGLTVMLAGVLALAIGWYSAESSADRTSAHAPPIAPSILTAR
jgi:hypothetical protein